MDSFIHFVHSHTKGALMILDVQGGYLKRTNGQTIFKLSDPAFTSTLGSSFGPSDCGAVAMNSFFSRHVCNSYCRSLGLKQPGHIAHRALVLDTQLLGHGKSTRSMSIAHTDKKLLEGLQIHPQEFAKIFKYLKAFGANSGLR
jgi:hypothetical protein